MNRCPACGHENQAGAKFCSECAAPMVEAKAAVREERKVVTVLFADLVGFTSRSEQLDPEDVRAFLSPYYGRLRAELERFGGTVEKFIGDAVMAVFGAPIAHEDDPERGVRAALAIRDWVQQQEVDLQLRIAVNTGQALVALGARPDQGEGLVSGDVVNTTARLQTAAPINGILVGETTYRATDQVITYRAAAPVTAKGKVDPVPAWEALEARSRVDVGDILNARGPLVGRASELRVLTDALGRMRQDRSPQLVTLVGVPGIGKSRLIAELWSVVEADPDFIHWRQGRSLPYGDGVTFWALAEMVKAQAGILETDSPDEAAEKLAAAVAALIPDPVDAHWVEGHLRPLAGINRDTDPIGNRRDEAFTAWRRFFEALSEESPLVLVFDDLHWADDNLLDFVEYVVDWAVGVPILVVCTTRPELFERRPGWAGNTRNTTRLSLSPLTDAETAELISGLSARPLMAAETQLMLLDRAGGNPLFAEQYVRMLAERSDADELPLPETVQGIIAARIDALPADEKRLLQEASVLGKVFWLGAVINADATAAPPRCACMRSSARISCSVRGVPSLLTRRNTRSCTVSSATSRTVRYLAASGRRSIGSRRNGSARSDVARIMPRCARITTGMRSNSVARPVRPSMPRLRHPRSKAFATRVTAPLRSTRMRRRRASISRRWNSRLLDRRNTRLSNSKSDGRSSSAGRWKPTRFVGPAMRCLRSATPSRLRKLRPSSQSCCGIAANRDLRWSTWIARADWSQTANRPPSRHTSLQAHLGT